MASRVLVNEVIDVFTMKQLMIFPVRIDECQLFMDQNGRNLVKELFQSYGTR